MEIQGKATMLELRPQDGDGGWKLYINGEEEERRWRHVLFTNEKFGVDIEVGLRPEGFVGPAISERGGTIVVPFVRFPGNLLRPQGNHRLWVGLLRAHRPNLGGELLEATGGFIEAGELASETAKRESQEETGIQFPEPMALGEPVTWNRLFQFVDPESGRGPLFLSCAEFPPEAVVIDWVEEKGRFSEAMLDQLDEKNRSRAKKIVFFPVHGWFNSAVFKTGDVMALAAIARMMVLFGPSDFGGK